MSVIYKFEPDNFKNRWVAYIDILGFGNLVRNNDYSETFILLSKIIDYMTNDTEYENNEPLGKDTNKLIVDFTYFSDSFVIYTEESDTTNKAGHNSIQRFDQGIRRILNYITEQQIPFRGALAYGELYADKESNIFFGKALLEAHEYGEAQDWIGFIACPSAVEQWETIGFNYKSYKSTHREWDIPYKENLSNALEKRLPAYKIVLTDNERKAISILETSRDNCSDDKSKTKYNKTIDFLKQFVTTASH